ncbi:sigma-70 family RNA polymerase sigma factor [Kribbella sp. NPDC051718]|uniref:RNA polymerase sigma factor n=1 Tax=Kribbella sp. NPDC051718 TaxID=3155168 RepID=UPI00342A96EA
MQTEETPHDAFCRLYAETWPDVLRYLGRRCGPDAAEDLANEVYLITWRRWNEVPGRRELPWLYGVARNLLLERSRAQGRDGIAVSAQATELPAYRDIAEGVVSAHVVRQVLAELKPNDREILILWAWEGLAPPDLGGVLGCRAATAAVRLHRARRRFSALYFVHAHDSNPDVPHRNGLRKAVSTDETV